VEASWSQSSLPHSSAKSWSAKMVAKAARVVRVATVTAGQWLASTSC